MARSLPKSHNRKSERVSSDEDAVILLADGRTRHPCKIIDRSEGGVQIKIDRSAELSQEFWLIAGTPQAQTICSLAWRVGSRAGCAFVAHFGNRNDGGAAPGQSGQDAIRSRLLKRPLIID
ncbi:MAG: hypothetical protein HKN11_12935 [Rhizobiales bacterium]|nr:hypothetical protein [Hyphomicrobiales bacterium]